VAAAALLDHPAVHGLFAAEIVRINPMIEVKYQRVHRFILVDRELSLERGELTPSGKVCRDRICDGCRREIEMLFSTEPPANVMTIEPPVAATALTAKGA